MLGLEQKNSTRSMMKQDFSDTKLDKSQELSDSMTINEGSKDEYESAIHKIGGAK